MKRNQSGFTLIELVVVIVILGILAVTAVPRFINLSEEAQAAALQGVVGAISSASAINYAACLAGNTECETTVGADCATAIPALLQQDPGYDYGAGTSNDLAATSAAGDIGYCTVTDPSDNTVTAQVEILAAE